MIVQSIRALDDKIAAHCRMAASLVAWLFSNAAMNFEIDTFA